MSEEPIAANDPGHDCAQDVEQMIAWYLQPATDELVRLGEYYLNGETEEACLAFTQEVRVHDAAVRLGYRNVVKCVKYKTDLAEIGKSWGLLISFIDKSLEIVSQLKERFPGCETPELHNNLLDFRAAAQKRLDYALEEEEALKADFPEGLIAAD